MLTIKVLGGGCKNCQILAQKAEEALETVAESQPEEFEATILKVTNPEDIQKYPILYTPGLVINEKLVSAGKIPNEAQVTSWLAEALEAA